MACCGKTVRRQRIEIPGYANLPGLISSIHPDFKVVGIKNVNLPTLLHAGIERSRKIQETLTIPINNAGRFP